MIEAYFSNIKELVDRYAATNFVLDTQINMDTRPGRQGYLAGRLIFTDGSELHFREYLDATQNRVDKLMYVYHYQTADKKLVFRYDNARHRPPLPSREHKHVADQVMETPSPTLQDVLIEIVTIQKWL